MPKHTWRDPKKARLTMLLAVPCSGVLFFALSTTFARSVDLPVSPWLFALHSSTAGYTAMLVLSLFMEREWAQAAGEYRWLEISIGLAGLGIAGFLLFDFLRTGLGADSSTGSLVGIASAALLYPRRTDRTRALAFGAMAIADFQRPLLSLRPPFMAFSVVWAALALGCLLRSRKGHTPVEMPVIGRVLLGALLTAVGVYGLCFAYQIGWLVGLLFLSSASLFFGTATVLLLARTFWPRG